MHSSLHGAPHPRLGFLVHSQASHVLVPGGSSATSILHAAQSAPNQGVIMVADCVNGLPACYLSGATHDQQSTKKLPRKRTMACRPPMQSARPP